MLLLTSVKEWPPPVYLRTVDLSDDVQLLDEYLEERTRRRSHHIRTHNL